MNDPSPELARNHVSTPPDAIAYATLGALGRRRTDWFSVGSFLCGFLAPFAAGAVAYTIELQRRMAAERFVFYVFSTFGAMVIAALILGVVGRRRINRSEGQLTGET